MIAALLLLAQAATMPSAQAEALGLRLARAGTLASLAPMTVDKDGAELAAEDATLTPAERERVKAIAREEGRVAMDRMLAAMGHGYAQRLSVADLKRLVAANESPAARRYRAAMPQVIAAAMAGAGAIDVKKQAAARMCTDTKKLCDRH